MTHAAGTILVTGATGYVGGRLLHALEERGHAVRCMARRPEYLHPRVGANTEVVRGDVLDLESLRAPLANVSTAYYLVHSMGAAEFAERDRQGARNFARAAADAGVRRIVYLGGLGRGGDLSEHLASRQEVGTLLAATGVPTIEFRASIILGSGSLSFEMVRALVERLPVMIAPRWVRRRAQPIGIEDVVAYLLGALSAPESVGGIFEIGGPDVVSYADLMGEYARQRGLRRLIVPVPVLSPRLSSLWLGLVTPVYARVGRELIDSVRHDTVVTDDRALRTFDVRPRGVAAAIARALVKEDHDVAATRWSDAYSSRARAGSRDGATFGRRLVDHRSREVPVSAARAFEPVTRIGGATGWYHVTWLWRVRGFLDLLVGGVGMRRGRRHPRRLHPGDTLDFWRVEAVEPPHLLRLQAEMRLPGRAWLQFEVTPTPQGARISQTALFDPVGLAGRLYWYALLPLHALVFAGMLRGLAKAAATR